MKRKVIVIMALIVVFIIIKSTNGPLIKVRQVKSEIPIVLSKKHRKNGVYVLQIYRKFEVRKKLTLRTLTTSCYNRSFQEGYYIFLFDNNNNYEHALINNNAKIDFYPKKYVNLAGFILSKDTKQYNLALPYIQRLESEGKDTIHIGTIAEFKKNNPEFLKIFTSIDSAKFCYINNLDLWFYKGVVYYGTINVPLEIK